MKVQTGAILWRGPSELTGDPIILIATGFDGARNGKTGPKLIQTYIIRDDMTPTMASQTGADAAICGGCVYRGIYANGLRVKGSRKCYVNLGQGPTIVYKSLAKGLYPVVPESELSDVFAGLMVRIGSYGDGAAVPAYIWHLILSQTVGRTGYTHQWRNPRFQYLKDYCMASVDSEEETRDAWAMGWRTFRVGPAIGWDKLDGEGLCPASLEAGKRVQCDKCFLCSGTKGHGKTSIVIPNHGLSGTAEKRRAGTYLLLLTKLRAKLSPHHHNI